MSRCIERVLTPKSTLAIVWCMEINKDQPNENKQRPFIWSLLYIAKEPATSHHLHLADTQRQAEERESFAVEKKKVSGVLHLGSVGLGKP